MDRAAGRAGHGASTPAIGGVTATHRCPHGNAASPSHPQAGPEAAGRRVWAVAMATPAGVCATRLVQKLIRTCSLPQNLYDPVHQPNHRKTALSHTPLSQFM
ncbi:hypothetical protein AAFF_G00212010 [Aldrovandia affinis]|uniref:Uncharacterized protein n=1 Tax=Aldrovandia affinis TaxID=143900 RepID=A0AAD7RH38_9TELE|nr:hypothetical protein AAFF_G00212010 [Aldrovandia affinis]